MSRLVYVALLAFIFCFSLNSAVYKAAGIRGIPMLDVTSMGMSMVALFLGPLLFRARTRRSLRRARWSSWGGLILVAASGGCLAFWLLSEGVSRAGVARGGLFLAMIPVSTAVLDHLSGGTIQWDDVLFGGMIVLGGVLVSSSGLGRNAPLGDLLLAAAVLAFSVSNVAARFAMKDLSSWVVTAFRGVGGAAGLLALGGEPLQSGRWGIYSGILSVLFLVSFYVVVHREGPTRASLANIVSGVLATVWGLSFFRETLTPIQWLGAAVVITGSILWVWRQERGTGTSPPPGSE